MTNDWQPIGTASRASSNDEILATDYDSIEIIHWQPSVGHECWETRDAMPYFPCLWQHLPDVPPLPEAP